MDGRTQVRVRDGLAQDDAAHGSKQHDFFIGRARDGAAELIELATRAAIRVRQGPVEQVNELIGDVFGSLGEERHQDREAPLRRHPLQRLVR
jgi:hypothetical protein